MRLRSYGPAVLVLEMAAVLLGLLFLVPFYFLGVNSVKTFAEILLNAAALPNTLEWNNYERAWEIMNFPRAFRNSLVITIASNLGLAVVSSMAAYWLVRRPTRLNNMVFLLFVAAMVIPFQSIMIPLMRVADWFNLINSFQGLFVCYLGFGVSLSVFLYHGFVKSIPMEIEESARVDGSTVFGVFWKIVFPLLKPMTVTIIILNSLWIWNDFLLPSLLIGDPRLRTIPLSTYSFFGQYTKQWDLALAALVMGITPIIIFFLSLQRYIMEGITAGSVKG